MDARDEERVPLTHRDASTIDVGTSYGDGRADADEVEFSFSVGRARRFRRSVDATLVACAACALVVGLIAIVARDRASVSLGGYREGVNRKTRLLTLSTACSPLELLRFDVGDWRGEVGARIALKGFDNELLFPYAKEMRETTCGTYEVNVTIGRGEQFGFFLYPKRYDQRGRGSITEHEAQLDVGCAKPGAFGNWDRCPPDATPSAMAMYGTQCSQRFVVHYAKNSGMRGTEIFQNRVFTGQTHFVWGGCGDGCADYQPPACAVCKPGECVKNHECVLCPPGKNNTGGDQPAGPDTLCKPVLCMANERVSNHTCVACGAGSVNDAGDDASGSDTQCDAIVCDIHERVVDHVCVECPPGSENEPGDDSSGPDTTCDAILCGVNEHVLNNACVACPVGHTHDGGDDSTLADTSCDEITCSTDERVSNHACVPCPPGTVNFAGDGASGDDTQCNPILCGTNQHVSAHMCTPCEPNLVRDAGDDASGPDTACEAPPPPALTNLPDAITPPAANHDGSGNYEVTINADPGVNVGEFSVIATTYGTSVQRDVRQISWYEFRRLSRKANVHALFTDQNREKNWLQSANVAYLFTLRKLVGQGVVVAVGNERIYNNPKRNRNSEVSKGPWTYDASDTPGQMVALLANTWTPNTWPDTYVVNPYDIDTTAGTFRVRIARVDSKRGNPFGWGDNDIRVVYAGFRFDAADGASDILAVGEIRVPRPPADDPLRTYSSVVLTHNLNRTDYQCLANVRIATTTAPARQIAVECQAGTATTITFTVADGFRRRWDNWVERDNVFVQYMLVPVSGAPVVQPDPLFGVPTIVGR